MDHIAIMRKSWGLTEKILTGEKIIESRWYLVGRTPWNRVKKGDIVYFKNSGEPVSLKAKVQKVLQFSGLTPKKVRELLKTYGEDDGIEKENTKEFFERFKNKKYCTLVFLKNAHTIQPFFIDKKGFGAMASWISLDDIGKIAYKEG